MAGLAMAVIAVALAAKRKVRTDEYAYSTAGSTLGNTAAFTEFSNPISQTLPHPADDSMRRGYSGSGSLSPAAVSPTAASIPHASPHGPPTFFDVDSPLTGRSLDGGTLQPQTGNFASAGPPSASGQPTTLSLPGHVDAVAEEDDSNKIAETDEIDADTVPVIDPSETLPHIGKQE